MITTEDLDIQLPDLIDLIPTTEGESVDFARRGSSSPN